MGCGTKIASITSRQARCQHIFQVYTEGMCSRCTAICECILMLYLLCILILLRLGFALALGLALCHLRALDGFLLCMARLYPDLLLMCRIADGLADMTAREAPIFADVLQATCLGMKTAKIHTVVMEDCQHSCQTRALARQCMDAIGVKGQTCRELSRARRYVERLKWCERNTSSSFSTRSPLMKLLMTCSVSTSSR